MTTHTPSPMPPLNVSLKSNGAYWQASWIDSTGARKVRSLGAKASRTGTRGLTEAQARSVCQRLGEALAREQRRPAGLRTIADLVEAYPRLRASELAPRTITGHLAAIEGLKAATGVDMLDTITPLDIATYRASIAEHAQEITVVGILMRLRAVLAWCRGLGVIGPHPMDGMRLRQPTAVRSKRYVSEADTLKVIDELPPGYAILVGLCRFAGLRLGEAVRIRPEHTDLDRRRLSVHPARGHATTKDRFREPPITPLLHQVLTEHRQQWGATLAGISTNNLHRTLAAAVARTNVGEFAFNDLRASCDQDWISRYPVADVCRWMGHSAAIAARHYGATRPETWASVTGLAGTKKGTKSDDPEAEAS